MTLPIHLERRRGPASRILARNPANDHYDEACALSAAAGIRPAAEADWRPSATPLA